MAISEKEFEELAKKGEIQEVHRIDGGNKVDQVLSKLSGQPLQPGSKTAVRVRYQWHTVVPNPEETG